MTRLLDLAKQRGFTFIPAGEDGSLWGERVTARCQDTVFLGVSGQCNAVRANKTLLSPGESLFAERVSGTALTVLQTVLYEWLPP